MSSDQNQSTLLQAMADALYASVMAGDSHYRHHDPKGTAGANCPACHARRDANELAYKALRLAKAEGIIPGGAVQFEKQANG